MRVNLDNCRDNVTAVTPRRYLLRNGKTIQVPPDVDATAGGREEKTKASFSALNAIARLLGASGSKIGRIRDKRGTNAPKSARGTANCSLRDKLETEAGFARRREILEIVGGILEHARENEQIASDDRKTGSRYRKWR